MTSSITFGGLSANFIFTQEFFRAAHHRHPVTSFVDFPSHALPDEGIRDVLEIPSHKKVDLMDGSKRDVDGVRGCNFGDES